MSIEVLTECLLSGKSVNWFPYNKVLRFDGNNYPIENNGYMNVRKFFKQ